MRKLPLLLTLALTAFVALAGEAIAADGKPTAGCHNATFSGTIGALRTTGLTVVGEKGRQVPVVVTDSTVIRFSDKNVSLSDLRTGERVVVPAQVCGSFDNNTAKVTALRVIARPAATTPPTTGGTIGDGTGTPAPSGDQGKGGTPAPGGDGGKGTPQPPATGDNGGTSATNSCNAKATWTGTITAVDATSVQITGEHGRVVTANVTSSTVFRKHDQNVTVSAITVGDKGAALVTGCDAQGWTAATVIDAGAATTPPPTTPTQPTQPQPTPGGDNRQGTPPTTTTPTTGDHK